MTRDELRLARVRSLYRRGRAERVADMLERLSERSCPLCEPLYTPPHGDVQRLLSKGR